MASKFDGIHEKLKRADENVLNLESKISGFFQECKYPVMPKINDEEHGKAAQYFKNLVVPLRFGVLSGEIVHHLRSCLDHIIWELSDDATRNSKDGTSLEFPILDTRPAPKDESSRYGRKIKGVTNVGALQLIKELQPYNRTYPTTDFLWLIHKMDITDKHRELVITHPTGYMTGPGPLMKEIRGHLTRGTSMSAELKRQFDQYGQITPQISFRDFPGWEAEPIVTMLTQLANYIRYIVIQFERLV